MYLTQEDIDYELNARYDFLAELTAEHAESDEALAAEAHWYDVMNQVACLTSPIDVSCCTAFNECDDDLPF